MPSPGSSVTRGLRRGRMADRTHKRHRPGSACRLRVHVTQPRHALAARTACAKRFQKVTCGPCKLRFAGGLQDLYRTFLGWARGWLLTHARMRASLTASKPTGSPAVDRVGGRCTLTAVRATPEPPREHDSHAATSAARQPCPRQHRNALPRAPR